MQFVAQEITGKMSVLTEGLPRTGGLVEEKQVATLLEGREAILVVVGNMAMEGMGVFMVEE